MAGSTSNTSMAVPASTASCADRTSTPRAASVPATRHSRPGRSGATTVTVEPSTSSDEPVPTAGHELAAARTWGTRRRRPADHPGGLAPEHQPGPVAQLGDQVPLPRRPGAGPGGQRVRLGERRQQVEGLLVADGLGHQLDRAGSSRSRRGRGIGQAAGGGAPSARGRPRRPAGTPCARACRAPARCRPRCGRGRARPCRCRGAARRRASRSGRPTRRVERGGVGGRLAQVPVDGEPVVGVALRAAPHRRPTRAASRHEQAPLVERLEHGDGGGARTEQARPGRSRHDSGHGRRCAASRPPGGRGRIG